MQDEYLKHFLVWFKRRGRKTSAPPRALRSIGDGNWLRSAGGGYFVKVPADSSETEETLAQRLTPLLRQGESVTVMVLSPSRGAQAQRVTWKYLEDHYSVKGKKRVGRRPTRDGH